MLIDKTKCVNCGQCIPYCPMACIQKKDGIVQIDLDECVECEACLVENSLANGKPTYPKPITHILI